MAELIDKWKVVDMLTALENEFQHYKPFQGFEHAMYRKVVAVEKEIGEMVAVEAEPIKHARWVHHNKGYNNWVECSNCSTVGSPFWNRCPLCEAKMAAEI